MTTKQTTGWINPPKSYHVPDDELPNYHGEWGLVFQTSDGTVWETTAGYGWVRCQPERAAFLKAKYVNG